MPLMNVTYMRQIENGGWETHDVTSDWNQYYVITLKAKTVLEIVLKMTLIP